MKRLDFKEYVKTTFQAFGSNSKKFHKQIQQIMGLKKNASMNITMFELDGGDASGGNEE